MELVKDPGKCCGCGACEQVCPKSAITMQEDEHGFLYPQIDGAKCVDCGLCLKTCAFQSGYPTRKEYDPPFGYAARHKDPEILMNSRSGGAFTAISDQILKMGGVIYGVGYEGRGYRKVVHKRAQTARERDEFCGSKYVQSDMRQVYRQVKQDLQDGRWVLFTGTGCQTGALHKFLGKEYARLLTMDLVCYGVPSPKVWRDFLDMREREERRRISAVDFRDKKKFGWKTHRETITVGKKKISSRLYTKIFIKALATRPSCFECVYVNQNRVGDITIADFWGHEEAVPGFAQDDRGVSLVMVNTEKGKQIWEMARDDLDVEECTGYPYRHSRMQTPTAKPKQYDEFWQDYRDRGFDYIMKKYCGYDVILPEDWKKKVRKLAGKCKRKLKKVLKKILK